MYRYCAIIVFSLIFLFGCVEKQTIENNFTNNAVKQQNNSSNQTSKKVDDQNNKTIISDKKLHPNEDFFILEALFAQQKGEIQNAAISYKKLYDETKKVDYLKYSIQLALSENNLTLINNLVDIGIKTFPNNTEMIRYHIARLLKENKMKEAMDIAVSLVEKEKTEQNLRLLGAIYFYMQEYNLALKSFESAYSLSKDEAILIQISEIYLKLNRINDAISLLETHARINGCTIDACSRLIFIYEKQQNLDGLLSTYKMLYDKFKQDEFAQKIFEIYIHKNDKKQAIQFLEETGYAPDVLMRLYAVQKEYQKAISLAKKLYDETGDIEYLGNKAIFIYESEENKNKILKSVSEKLEKVVEKSSNPIFFNYYGYLLIDHDLDIKKGIDLVEKALKKDPYSPYYLDSLAWGFYKDGKCKEALDIIKPIFDSDVDEEEIKLHYHAIQKCLKNNENK